MDRFTATIDGWTSWGRVFQSIEAFEPLIRHILSQHALPIAEIEHCTPGTNAVFKVEMCIRDSLHCLSPAPLVSQVFLH